MTLVTCEVRDGAGLVVASYVADDGTDPDPGLGCRLVESADGVLVAYPGATHEIDGLRWPIAYAGAVLASYRSRFGGRVMVERRDVLEHVAALCGWPYPEEATCPPGPGSPSPSSLTSPSPSRPPSPSAAASAAAPATTPRPPDEETAR